MLINVGAEFGKNLETSEIAIELVDILNKIPEEEFIIDFKDVEDVEIKVIETSREEKQTIDGQQVSYDPQHYTSGIELTRSCERVSSN